MEANIQQAIDAEDWDSLRLTILQKHKKNRASVGLPLKSDLTLFQVIAFYEPDLVPLMQKAGFECDLHSACALGNTDRIAELATSSTMGEFAEYMTPMGYAILKNQTASVKQLLDQGDDPNRITRRIGFFQWEIEVIDEGRWVPLHAASTHGYYDSAPEIIETLVQHGADLEQVAPLGCTSLALASIYSWTHVMNRLLDLGANINATSERNSNRVWTLSAPVHGTRDWGHTPLMTAVGEGQLNAVRLLLDRGADTSVLTNMKDTVLHIAAVPWWKENIEVLKVLLEAKVSAESRNLRGSTPYDNAVKAGYRASAQLLEENRIKEL